jgi:hypothetical protein
MTKHEPKVTESCEAAFRLRLNEFSAAIHNYGVGRLFSDLKSNGKITATYSLTVFRNDFKNMKSLANGFLNNPALIGEICDLIKFPASALFGGFTTSFEDTKEMIKTEMRNTQLEIENEKKIPKKRIYNDQILIQSNNVFCIIAGIINQNYQNAEPVKRLFIWYSIREKTWDHYKETRIKITLEKILYGIKGITYAQFPYSLIDNNIGIPDDIISLDTFWNLCLIIAYQLSCIDKMYALHLKSKQIKKRKIKGNPSIVSRSTVKYEINYDNGGGDLFAEELKKFCSTFDLIIKKDIFNKFNFLENGNNLKIIISNFQNLILFLANPKPLKNNPQSYFGNSPIDYFIQTKALILQSYELIITDKELYSLRECNLLVNSIHDGVLIAEVNNQNITKVQQPLNIRLRNEQDDLIDADLLA